MKYESAFILFDKHRNLNGHIIKQGAILIAKVFIAPTDKAEFDKFMFHLFRHNLHVSPEFAEQVRTMDVDVYVLYFDKTKGVSNTMFLNNFIAEVIPLEDLYNNVG